MLVLAEALKHKRTSAGHLHSVGLNGHLRLKVCGGRGLMRRAVTPITGLHPVAEMSRWGVP